MGHEMKFVRVIYHASEANHSDVESLCHCDEWENGERCFFDEIEVDDN